MPRGGENREHHKGSVSIKRAHPECDRDSDSAKTVDMKRGGLTYEDLFKFGMWWADRWAMSEPGVTFFAVANWSGQREYRTVMPPDFPPVPLPESSEEFDRQEREYMALWDHPTAEEKQRQREAEVMAESEALLERVRAALAREAA